MEQDELDAGAWWLQLAGFCFLVAGQALVGVLLLAIGIWWAIKQVTSTPTSSYQPMTPSELDELRKKVRFKG